MERTVLSISAANFVTVNLMVILMGFVLLMLVRVMRGRADG